MKRLFSLAVVLALAASACSSDAPAGSSKPGGQRSNGITVGESSTPASGGKATAGTSASNGAVPASPGASPTGPTPPPGAIYQDDAVYARVNENVPWDCMFKPGDSCKVYWEGTYVLITRPKGKLVFGAFENGSATPASRAAFDTPRDAKPFKFRMPYKVGANAKTVRFQAWLETPTGEVLARSRSYDIPVTPA